MPTNSGKNLLATYIRHLESAAVILDKLPNKFYRDQKTNLTLHQQKDKLMQLADEINDIWSLLPPDDKD